MEALSGQTAIAIDNAELFKGLQQFNFDLQLVYDSTLEGWMCALDPRYHATEGHMARMAEMRFRLTSSMGLRDAGLVQARRGALLHDIGKLGLPDSILLKHGPFFW